MNFFTRIRLDLLVLAFFKALVLHATAQTSSYHETILVASRPEYHPAAFVDQHIENAWGIALRPPGAGGHIWVSNPRTASTSLYIGDVNGVPLHQDGLKIVYMDGPLISYEGGVPQVTGQVYNAASDVTGQPIEFAISGPASDWTSGSRVSIGTTSGAAKFVFVTKDGTVNAWRANTATSMDSAIIVKDYSDHGPDQIPNLPRLPAFTGVAMTTNAFTLGAQGQHLADNRLYIADFQSATIRVVNNQWQDITSTVPFEKPAGLAAVYSPYNIQYLGDTLYVTYAVVDASSEEPAFDIPEGDDGELFGHVYAYDRNGHLLHGFQDGGLLSSPWGLALAPETFGKFGGDLLVGSFGTGNIAAFDPRTGAFDDYLREADGEPIAIDGLWGLTFGNGVSLGDANALYYTAGPNLEQDGVFGRVNVSQAPEPGSMTLGLAGGALLLARPRRPRFNDGTG